MQVSCIRICVFAKTAFYLGQGNRDLAGNLFRRRVPSFHPQLRWSSPLPPLKEVPAESACLEPNSKEEGSSVPDIFMPVSFNFDQSIDNLLWDLIARRKYMPLTVFECKSISYNFPCQFTLASLKGESPVYKAQASVVINITYKSTRAKCTQTSV